ncbi:MAG: low molecular weight phosphotyrosine protein phosphatase [Roseburia sp.]|nr:low molecular weight phosphotyrosine protein phosphatase [Anaeroplasma bactoclasticum]MCM1196548.1 low molecular weight phosphotyrosine protein phosphatase [Roseburia sp.]MCM1557628.1 low molecular weight phosphotyrosine protein phosphatase [Anaeroplasma bactoclasticum]
MIKVLFVCHGNICRSPMAEFLFKDYVHKNGVEEIFHIESAATSSEEIGNPIHYGTRKILSFLGIDCSKKRARKVRIEDIYEYDFIIGMDQYNIASLKRFFDTEDKIYSLLDFANLKRDISDPWYTGDFQKTYEDICIGIEAFYQFLVIKHLI